MRIRLTVEHDDREYDVTYEPETEEARDLYGHIVARTGPTIKQAIADVTRRMNAAIEGTTE